MRNTVLTLLLILACCITVPAMADETEIHELIPGASFEFSDMKSNETGRIMYTGATPENDRVANIVVYFKNDKNLLTVRRGEYFMAGHRTFKFYDISHRHGTLSVEIKAEKIK